MELVGGETAVMPDVIRGLDLAGTCAGLAAKEAVFDGAAEPGDALVGWRSSGIHSNGLTLAREAATREHAYTDPCPFDGYETVGEALLEPTRIYTDLLDPMRDHGARRGSRYRRRLDQPDAARRESVRRRRRRLRAAARLRVRAVGGERL